MEEKTIIEFKLEDLEMSEDSKKIIENSTYVPIMMISPKLAIIDEAYLLLHKVDEAIKIAFYDYVVAINQFLNKSQ